MNIADISIKRPVFITCVFALILIVGGICLNNIGIDLFPDVTFPVVVVTTVYPGASPEEIETEISKVIEGEMSTLAGIKALKSSSQEGLSIMVAEFTQETDIKYATQQVRDRLALLKAQLPTDAKDPLVRNVDPGDLPIATVGVSADLSAGKIYDLADERIKTTIEQVDNVGLVEILGARKREIHVELDRAKLKKYELSASGVAAKIGLAGKNIPAGKVVNDAKETVIRSMAEFKSLKDIGRIIVNFVGNDVPVTVADVGTVEDGLSEETSRATIDGKSAVFLNIYKQSGSNTVAVFDHIEKAMVRLNTELAKAPGQPHVTVVRNGARPIKLNIEDVKQTIFIGIILTILVVYLFLGNLRSTIITGIALPNSLIGAFILLAVAGFTINVTSLLGLSLAIGLLIDDAIVVRENIFRHMEMGEPPLKAASVGTREVVLAVIATTLCILAVFGPVAFIGGIIGKFLIEFGLTVCFAMIISLFDSLTMGPMLSAYFGGITRNKKEGRLYRYTLGCLLHGFDRFQEWLAATYETLLRVLIHYPFSIILSFILIFIGSLFALAKTPMNFMNPMDTGEFQVDMDMPSGITLDGMTKVTQSIEALLRSHAEVASLITTIGTSRGESNLASIYVKLVPGKERAYTTSRFKDVVRDFMRPFAYANPKVKDVTGLSGGERAFAVNIIGPDMDQLQKVSNMLLLRLKDDPDLKDVDTSYRIGKPELRVVLSDKKAPRFGISSSVVGNELRTMIEGATPAIFRENGRDYDIRVRLREDQRHIDQSLAAIYMPNINGKLVKLAAIAAARAEVGPATINREDRGRYIQISADIAPSGGGMAKAKADVAELFSSGQITLPAGMRYKFGSQADNFSDLVSGILTAGLLGLAFIYLVLASLYESFITPITIMMVFPLALSGAFLTLYFTHQTMDMLAMIGCVMLIGLSTKNSILLVDYANRLVHEEGHERDEAIIAAGRIRLRPILMTSIAVIAGMVPLAVGLSEVSSQRKAMGSAVIGGVVVSTLLTLLVVPAVYSYLDRFRAWSLAGFKKLFSTDGV